MSRIGNQVIIIPEKVEFANINNNVQIKGPKGALAYQFDQRFKIEQVENTITVKREADDKETKSLHGTTSALIKNMLNGVATGFEKKLQLNGVGYRTTVTAKEVTLLVGFSHPVVMAIPEGLAVESPSNTELTISGIDKQQVGEFAAKIRKVRPPEPYKGKGIKYIDEIIRRKEGKRAG